MKFFQKPYDFLRNLVAPLWLERLIKELNDIILGILYEVGKGAISAIKDKIVEVSQEDITSKKKFDKVFKFGKELIPSITDSALNLLIEVLVSTLKQSFDI